MPLIKRRRQQAPSPPNGHAGKANGEPTIPDMQSEIASIHARLKLLTQERERIALASVRGYADARARIAEIDAERHQLLARKETLESAIRALHQERRSTDWRSRIPQMRRIQTSWLLVNEWGVFVDNIAALTRSQEHQDIDALKRMIDDIEGAEARWARYAADEVLPRHAGKVWFNPGDIEDRQRAMAEKDRLNEERQRLIEEAVTELLSTPLQRPRKVEEALQVARSRIATAPDKLQGLGTTMDGPIARIDR